MPSFLRGESRPKEEPDPRTEDVPDPPVESMEELKERSTKVAVNGEMVEKLEEVPTQNPPSSSEIDISKLDIRVGVIRKAWLHPEADKLFCEEIDIGEDSPRQIASGLREHYRLEDLEGQRVLVLANLKARKLVGFSSHGMVCCSSKNGKVQFVEPPEGAAIGERVMVEGYEGEPATENQVIKKKMLEAIFPDLKTNSNGIACYKGVPLSTSAGPCKSSLLDADVA
jgi:methionine--tRNA ligase beta chain